MAQHDGVIGNDDGASVRADINSALAAIRSNNSDASTFPASAVQGMSFTQNLSATQQLEWKYDGTQWVLERIIDPTNHKVYPANVRKIHGLTLSNDVTDATNDIVTAAGWTAADDDGCPLILLSALTGRLDGGTWAVGTNQPKLDTGSIGNNTYHVYLIRRSDTGVVDILFSTSASSPTMPANYDQKRRIGSIIRSGGAIVAFKQFGDDFIRDVTAADYASTNPGTSAVSVSLSVPAGIQVIGRVIVLANDVSVSASTHLLLTSADQTDTVPSSSAFTLRISTNNSEASTMMDVKTDTSRQIRFRLDQSTTDHVVRIQTFGWIDRRGQDDAA